LNNISFLDLKLAPEILKAVIETGYTTPTPIQAQAIPLVLEGCDLMARKPARVRPPPSCCRCCKN